MEALAKSKFQRYSARKVSVVLDQIRGKKVSDAEQIVSMVPRGSSGMVRKAIHSAAANLSVKSGKKIEPSKMWVKTAFASQGPMKNMRRFNAGPMGRAMPFKRKVCHLTVVVSDGK